MRAAIDLPDMLFISSACVLRYRDVKIDKLQTDASFWITKPEAI